MTDFSKTKKFFHLPEGMVYLDGNSLGPLPVHAADCVSTMLRDEWGEQIIKGWNNAGWMQQPLQVGNRVGKLIGAADGTVVMGDTLSIKVYQALAAAIEQQRQNPKRKVILSDTGNFPTDLYMAEGLIKTLDNDYQLRLVEPEQIAASFDDTVAVLLLTQVDYKTGRIHDMQNITNVAHQHDVLTVWDLAHSAGAIPVDVTTTRADYAVGCTYKYLNGGPGAPAFIYVAPQHADNALPSLSGWLGHDAPFAFETSYRAGGGINRMRVGTPPVIALAALSAALDVWDDVNMDHVRARSIELTELFIKMVEARCPELTLASPRDPLQRGSQVSFYFENGYAAIQALIADNVIGDFRAPDIMRFGFCPLYIGDSDVHTAVDRLELVLRDKTWDQPKFHQQSAVT